MPVGGVVVSSVRGSVVVAGVLWVPGGLGARGVDTDRMDAICRPQHPSWSGECGMRGLFACLGCLVSSSHVDSSSGIWRVCLRSSVYSSKFRPSTGSEENVKSVTPLFPHPISP